MFDGVDRHGLELVFGTLNEHLELKVKCPKCGRAHWHVWSQLEGVTPKVRPIHCRLGEFYLVAPKYSQYKKLDVPRFIPLAGPVTSCMRIRT